MSWATIFYVSFFSGIWILPSKQMVSRMIVFILALKIRLKDKHHLCKYFFNMKLRGMSLLKSCTQYTSKYGKLSSGRRIGKGRFHSSSKEGNAKECSHTAQLHISHAYKLMLKIIQSSMWTKNFQLDLEKARNQRSNCQHLMDHKKSKRIPVKHLLLLHWLC